MITRLAPPALTSGCRRRVTPRARAATPEQSAYNVVITGSTKGLGLALARTHLEQGDNVVVCSRTQEAVKAVVKELGERFGSNRVEGRVCNVSKAQDVSDLVAASQDTFGEIDIWINNAGTNSYTFKPLVEVTESDLMDIVDTNVLGVMLCCQAAIKAMRRQKGGGHIFNMNGAGADGRPTPRFAAYGATKRSITQLNKSLLAEMKELGISNVGLHTLAPGMVTTDLLMSCAKTPQAKFFINCIAETADTVATDLVPQIRAVPRKRPLGAALAQDTTIEYLSAVRFFSALSGRLVLGKRKSRFVSEE